MKGLTIKCAVSLSLILCCPGFATARDAGCDQHTLKGRYIFVASGFTRAPTSGPGTPWVPKAVFQVMIFNGDGTLTTPFITLANPFGDSGQVIPPFVGAPGNYSVNEDCTGSVQFLDANSVKYTIFVSPHGAQEIRMIQTNPVNNVIQGIAKRQ